MYDSKSNCSLVVMQALMAVQNQHDMAKVDEIAAQVSALDNQLRSASKEAAQINTREGLLGRPITDYSQVKQLQDLFDPFLQFWTTAASWKVSLAPRLAHTTGIGAARHHMSSTHLMLNMPTSSRLTAGVSVKLFAVLQHCCFADEPQLLAV